MISRQTTALVFRRPSWACRVLRGGRISRRGRAATAAVAPARTECGGRPAAGTCVCACVWYDTSTSSSPSTLLQAWTTGRSLYVYFIHTVSEYVLSSSTVESLTYTVFICTLFTAYGSARKSSTSYYPNLSALAWLIACTLRVTNEIPAAPFHPHPSRPTTVDVHDDSDLFIDCDGQTLCPDLFGKPRNDSCQGSISFRTSDSFWLYDVKLQLAD